jgi:hypothetical protein
MKRETATMEMRKMIIIIAGTIGIAIGALYVFGSVGDENVLAPAATSTTPAPSR